MKLQILISTIDSGIEKIKNIILPERPDVVYIIVHQYSHIEFNYLPNELKRTDITIYHIKGRGLTKSRNHAISYASEGICLIADDDVSYTNQYFDTIIKIFQTKEPDVALFKIRTHEDEEEYKNYPPKEYKLRLENMHSPSSIEIAFDTKKIQNVITFDERFGLGSFLNGGGELFFIRDAIEKNLDVWYYPYYVVSHPRESTIKSFPKFHKRRVMVAGANDARIHGWISLLRSLGFSFKLISDLLDHKKNPMIYLIQRCIGNIYILSSRHKISSK